MTSTKIVYLIAAITPFGFVLLASAVLVHRMTRQRREAKVKVVSRTR